MALLFPWAIAVLAVVVAAAVWTLARPHRRIVTVASLSLWRQAGQEAGGGGRRRSRRVTLPWLLLTAGALAAALALGRPAHVSAIPCRHVALALCPSAELGEPGRRELAQASRALLQRLGTDDRVQILLPMEAGGAGPWMPPAAAAKEIDALALLPVAAGTLTFPPPAAAAQRVYLLGPSGAQLPPAEAITSIPVNTSLPAVTFDAADAALLGDGSVRVFFALANHRDAPFIGAVLVAAADANGARRPLRSVPVSLAARERKPFVAPVPPPGALSLTILTASGTPLDGAGVVAYMAPTAGESASVAMIGADNPLVRRFIEIDPLLRLAAAPPQADIVIADGVDPPPGKPALVINPSSPPPGMTASVSRSNLALIDASVDARDAVTRAVDLAPVAVRQATPWRSSEGGVSAKPLVSLGEDVLIARSVPADSAGDDGARRIYVALDIAPANTNFSMTPSFVIFMANCMRWLAPSQTEHLPHQWQTVGPVQAQELAGVLGPADAASMPAPGLYSTGHGLLAVSVLGLASAPAEPPAAQTAQAAPLPLPVRAGQVKEYWPHLALAALVFWLAGWTAAALGGHRMSYAKRH